MCRIDSSTSSSGDSGMNRNLRVVQRLVLPLFVLSLAACGFHLRGTGHMATQMAPITVMDSSNRDTDRVLREALSRIDALADDEARSTGRIALQREQLRRRPLATAGQGAATQYELRLELTYEFQGAKEGSEVNTRSVFAERNYEFDVSNLAANSQEEELLTSEMLRELVGQIVRQLAAMQEADEGR